jgi:hypothetical protein
MASYISAVLIYMSALALILLFLAGAGWRNERCDDDNRALREQDRKSQS